MWINYTTYIPTIKYLNKPKAQPILNIDIDTNIYNFMLFL